MGRTGVDLAGVPAAAERVPDGAVFLTVMGLQGHTPAAVGAIEVAAQTVILTAPGGGPLYPLYSAVNAVPQLLRNDGLMRIGKHILFRFIGFPALVQLEVRDNRPVQDGVSKVFLPLQNLLNR